MNLEELLRIPADQVRDRIERVGNADVVRLRGNLLPLIRLTYVIGVDSTYIRSCNGRNPAKSAQIPVRQTFQEERSGLLETRLSKIIGQEKCQSYGARFYKAKADTSRKLEIKIVDAISTNETLFFRDTSPFELLKYEILPEVFNKKAENGNCVFSQQIRIWSAACSTGQEIYSIAMVLKELLGDVNRINLHAAEKAGHGGI